jgi:hypothetical protein
LEGVLTDGLIGEETALILLMVDLGRRNVIDGDEEFEEYDDISTQEW